MIKSIQKTGRFVGVTEAYENSSFINEVMAQINDKAFDWLDAPMVRLPLQMSLCPCRSSEDLAIPNGIKLSKRAEGDELMAEDLFIPKLGQLLNSRSDQLACEDGAKVDFETLS